MVRRASVTELDGALRPVAIRASGVSKTFRLPHESRNTVREYVLHPLRRTTYELQQALADVSFSIHAGEFFGVIGRNGSGKSTLLKLLAGIYSADAGTVEVHGKLSPFIELGVGFNPELNARDNIRINGTLLGLTTDELEERFDDILEFAELRRFVDQKLKNYSSGMQLRLAFSIAIQVPFDILLLDEVLAVGDQNFQEKCFATFESMRVAGKTVVLVTHNMGSAARFCERILLLRDGVVQALGEPDEVIETYLAQEKERGDAATPVGLPPAARRAEPARSGESPNGEAEDSTAAALREIEEIIRYQEAGLDHRAPRRLADLRNEVKEATRELTQLGMMTRILTTRHYGDLPLPPPLLRRRMATRASRVNFLAQGLTASDKVIDVFGESPGQPILEWGCGPGRTLRWLLAFPDWRERYRGCDTDADALAWLVDNLNVQAERCGDEPPLPYPDETFGGVFAFGTLTSIHPEQHPAWYAELARVLRPSGRAFVATQGPSLVPPDRSLTNGWAFVEHESARSAAFVTAEYTGQAIEGLFALEDHQERGHGLTDTYLLRRLAWAGR